MKVSTTTRRTAFTNEFSTKQFPDHSFLLRRAPKQSRFAGQLCAEIHCPSHLWATDPMISLNIQYTEVERATITRGSKCWKLFRFTCSSADLLKLAAACESPTDTGAKFATEFNLFAIESAINE